MPQNETGVRDSEGASACPPPSMTPSRRSQEHIVAVAEKWWFRSEHAITVQVISGRSFGSQLRRTRGRLGLPAILLMPQALRRRMEQRRAGLANGCAPDRI